MKRIIIISILCHFTFFAYAQVSGGEIKRENSLSSSHQTRKQVRSSSKTISRHKQSTSSTNKQVLNKYSVADLYNIGNNYYDSGKYNEAIIYYKKAAEAGHVEAQSELGHMFFRGEGVKINYKEAFKWLYLAANGADLLAQSTLGYMYQHGIGTAYNESEAYKWYSRASIGFYQGGKKAMKNDGKIAIQLFEIVISMNTLPYHVWANFQIGNIYYHGFGGVTVDYNKARDYFTEAAKQGNNPAKYYLGLCYLHGFNNKNMADFWMKSSGYSSIPDWDF